MSPGAVRAALPGGPLVEMADGGLQLRVMTGADLKAAALGIGRVGVMPVDPTVAFAGELTEEERDDALAVPWKLPPLLGVVGRSLHRVSRGTRYRPR